MNNTATWNGAKLWENVLEIVAERAFPYGFAKLWNFGSRCKFDWIRRISLDPKADKEPDIVISEDRTSLTPNTTMICLLFEGVKQLPNVRICVVCFSISKLEKKTFQRVMSFRSS